MAIWFNYILYILYFASCSATVTVIVMQNKQTSSYVYMLCCRKPNKNTSDIIMSVGFSTFYTGNLETLETPRFTYFIVCRSRDLRSNIGVSKTKLYPYHFRGEFIRKMKVPMDFQI